MPFRQSEPLRALPPKVFISHSHQDRGLVERLANDLLSNRILVWWDNWMIRVGDSLIRKIEEGISSSSYLCVVLTPASVSSAWVQEELSAALVRQLEEKRVFVMPVLAQDCEIPLFLRDKKYADFRTDYQDGLEQLLRSLKPVSVWSNSRRDEGPYHHDWAFEWGKLGGNHAFRLQVTTHSEKLPYAINCVIVAVANERYSARLDSLQDAGFEYGPRSILLLWSRQLADQLDAVILIEGDEEARDHISSVDPVHDVGLDLDIAARRLGPDPGDDILYEWKPLLLAAVDDHLQGIRDAHPPEELVRLDNWLDDHDFEVP